MSALLGLLVFPLAVGLSLVAVLMARLGVARLFGLRVRFMPHKASEGEPLSGSPTRRRPHPPPRRRPTRPWICSRKPLRAHLDGFDLHAAVAIAADDREGLERLSRYLLRPSVAQDRIEQLDDGRIRIELKTEWSDGTSDLVFEPLELLGRLASFVPRPRSNLLIYHGILAPNAKWRPAVVGYGRCDHSAALPRTESEPPSSSLSADALLLRLAATMASQITPPRVAAPPTMVSGVPLRRLSPVLPRSHASALLHELRSGQTSSALLILERPMTSTPRPTAKTGTAQLVRTMGPTRLGPSS